MSEQQEVQDLDPKVKRIVNHMAVLVASFHAHKQSGRLRFSIEFDEGDIPEGGYEESIRPRLPDGGQ